LGEPEEKIAEAKIGLHVGALTLRDSYQNIGPSKLPMIEPQHCI